MPLGDGGLVFEARTLAQGHPLTPLARRYMDQAVAQQRLDQPIVDIGIWAGYSLTNGYCLRRVEETAAGLTLGASDDADVDLERLDREAERIASALRTGDASRHILAEEDQIIAALDHLIAGEVERRLDHWRDSVDEKAWAELEEYLTWWTVKGYALRVAEMSVGALA